MKHKPRIRCEEIHSHIHRIILPLPGRQPGPVNAYLFLGKQTTLLDTGTSRTARHLEESLRQIGIGFPDIDRIILTHGHIDHYGAARQVVKRSSGRAVVAAHREDASVVETGMEVSDRQFSKFYGLMDVPLVFEFLFYGMGLFFSSLAKNCRVDLCLSDGEKIQAGDYEATIISTPGHTKGSICLYLEKEGILFSGDHILGHITPNAFVMLESDFDIPWRMSQVEFYDSLKKIESLAPRIVYPAHGKSITDLSGTTAMYREQFSLRQEKILAILKEGEFTVYRIARNLFPEISGKRLPLEIFLAVSEVFTHLQVLEKNGLVASRVRWGKQQYSLA
ncbi:MAG TPA: MBL fold metallo-hydrolase [Smithellaceae bacterium]|nr:MBL fold metallo-hydrolase [Smithella sp.]HPL98096.1 MBL fold metallo-hydrolase [Smithellaceae bacterium]HQP25879.1 MBL fold metallo-hydrolase [Smithellaceae bacterium]